MRVSSAPLKSCLLILCVCCFSLCVQHFLCRSKKTIARPPPLLTLQHSRCYCCILRKINILFQFFCLMKIHLALHIRRLSSFTHWEITHWKICPSSNKLLRFMIISPESAYALTTTLNYFWLASVSSSLLDVGFFVCFLVLTHNPSLHHGASHPKKRMQLWFIISI